MPRACAVLLTCLGSRADSENAPPPAPFSYAHPQKGRGRRGDSEGTWGGAGKKKRKKNTKGTTKDTNTPEQGQTAGADGTWREPGGTARGAGQGDAPGDESWEAGTNGGGAG